MVLDALEEPTLRAVALHAAAGFPNLFARVVQQLHASSEGNGQLSEEIIGCLAAMLGEIGSPLADYECLPDADRMAIAARVNDGLQARCGLRLVDLIGADRLPSR